MASHKMHLGLDSPSGVVLLRRHIHRPTLRKGGRRNNRSVQNIQWDGWQVTKLAIIGHNLLKLALVIPCLGMTILGMFSAGSVMYAAQVRADKAYFVSHITELSLRELSQVNI